MELTVNLENLSESERNSLMSLVKKSTKPKLKVWKPKVGEIYYSVNSDGTVLKNCFHSMILDEKRWIFDEKCWEFGNCYKTEEEVEFAIQHRRVEIELQRFAEEHNEGEINWSDDNPKHRICYNYQIHEIEIVYFYYYHTNDVYFTSKEIAQSAIEAFGEERLIKYYFGVKEC